MKIRFCFTLVATFLVIFASTQLRAESSVWKVSGDNGNYFYLGGTVHLLSEQDHPLPDEFDKAYADTQHIWFETDIEAAQSPAFQAQMMTAMMLPPGQRLQDTLSEQTYARLATFMLSRGIPAEQFSPFSATGTGLVLVVMEYQRMGLQPQWGVETVMNNRAVSDGKRTSALETPEEQISFIANMSGGDDDKMIDYTLRDLERLPSYFGDLKQAWRTGNLKAMETAALSDLKKEFPRVHDTLIVNRNRNWMAKLPSLLDSKDIEFVLVGTLHLVGKEGLVQQLRGKGYTVKQL